MGNSSSSRRSPLNTTPTGLYPVCAWDAKVVRRLILERKLAPFESPQDEPLPNSEECPICFLYYSGGLNRSRCCRKGACTECYLQVKRPNQSTTCPFCNHAQYIVSFTGPLSKEEVAQEAQEQQKVQELKTIMRNEEIERDKQRMLEKERLRKEQELSGIVVPPSTAQHAPPPVQPPPVAHSVPSNPQLPPPFGFNQHYGSTYPPPNSSQHNFSAGDNSMAEADLDDLMLMEAIRLSLLDVQPQNTTSTTTVPNPPHLNESSDSEDNYNSDDNNSLRRPITKHMTTETTTSTSTPITTLETIPNTTVLQEQLYDQDDFQDPLQLPYEPQLSDSKFTGSYIHNPQNSQHPQISQHEPVQDLIDPQKHQELTNLQDPLQPQDSQHPQDSQDHKDPQEPEDPEHSQDPQGSPAPQDPSHSQHCQDPQDSHELQDSQHSNLQDSQFLADLDTPQPGTDTNTTQSTTTLNPLFTQDPHPHHLHTPTNNATNSVTLPADPNECPPSQDIPHPKESDEETNEEATHTNTEGSL